MHKVILIILATVVNELAAAYDESKLVDNCIFNTANQYGNEYRWMPAILMEVSVSAENVVQYIKAKSKFPSRLYP